MTTTARPMVLVRVGPAAYVDAAQVAAICWSGVYDCPTITLVGSGFQVFATDFRRPEQPTDKAMPTDELRAEYGRHVEACIAHIRESVAVALRAAAPAPDPSAQDGGS